MTRETTTFEEKTVVVTWLYYCRPTVELRLEFVEKGTLSDESYAALEAKGYNRVLVDGYIAGQVARAQALTNEVHAAVGGAEKYAAMTQWAAGKLSAAEVTKRYGAVAALDAGAAMGA